MSELTQVLRFSPRTIEDEMRIYRAKPIAWTDSSVALLNEYGATLCTPDREATPLFTRGGNRPAGLARR